MTSYKTDPTAFVPLPGKPKEGPKPKKKARKGGWNAPEEIRVSGGFVPPTGETIAEYNTIDSARKEYAKYHGVK